MGDSLYLMEGAPYLSISNGGLLQLLRRTETAGMAYRKFLPLYPEVCCEPLEFVYQCRRNVDALDVHLLSDLLFLASWREANWGAWLAALAPTEKYKQLLLERRETLSHGTDIIDLAAASIEGKVPDRLANHFEALGGVPQMLAEVRPVVVPLRQWPTLAQEAQYNGEVEQIRQAYRRSGLGAALECMRHGMVGYNGESYGSWLSRGAPKYV